MVKIEEDIKFDFNDVLIKPKRSNIKSRNDVILERRFVTKHSQQEIIGVPIMIANMDTTGTFEMFLECQKYKIITCIHKHYKINEWIDFINNNDIYYEYLSISTGISDNDFEKTKELLSLLPNINMICIDIANGYTEYFLTVVKKFREEFPKKILIAGNVCTPEMTEQLIISGADIVKVGIGPGSACTTRKQTGIGYPQLSCVMECADAAHGIGGLIISDGGCTVPGDFSKAFGGGADFVMAGGYFAGHTESGGDLIEENGKQFKEFYGMSSDTAMNKYAGGVANYRSSEGKTVKILYKGDVINTINDLLGGIRSTLTYVGAKYLKELSKRTTFIKVNNQLNNIYTS
jgi:GMP reductase